MAVVPFDTAPPNLPAQSGGDLRVAAVLVTFDNSYLAGGEPITAASVGLTRIRFGYCSILTPSVAGAAAGGAVLPQVDGSALLKLNTATAEVANAVDCSGIIASYIFWGE